MNCRICRICGTLLPDPIPDYDAWAPVGDPCPDCVKVASILGLNASRSTRGADRERFTTLVRWLRGVEWAERRAREEREDRERVRTSADRF